MKRILGVMTGVLYFVVAIVAAPILFIAVAVMLILDRLDGYNKR